MVLASSSSPRREPPIRPGTPLSFTRRPVPLPESLRRRPHAYGRIAIRLALREFLCVLAAAYLASVFYNWGFLHSWPSNQVYVPTAIGIALIELFVAISFGHFARDTALQRNRFLWTGIGAAVLAFSFFQTALFLLKLADDYSRVTFLIQLIAVTSVILCLRALEQARLRQAVQNGVVRGRRAILIGEDGECARVAKLMNSSCVHVVGTFCVTEDSAEADRQAVDVNGLVEFSRAFRADDLILLATSDDLSIVSQIAKPLSEAPVSFHIVPVGVAEFLASGQLSDLGGIVTLQVLHQPIPMLGRLVKRAFDLVVATAALLCVAPILAAAAVAIKFDSKGPVFFLQGRHGYNNEVIRVLKLRTMRVMEDGAEVTQAKQYDPRITRVGRLLRSTNIDELPQLINVIKGEMSLVGPRPQAVAHNSSFAKLIISYARRHNVKPGITGWAQVNGYRGQTDTLDKMQRRIEHDLYYIENWSFLLDLKIIALTLTSKKAFYNAH